MSKRRKIINKPNTKGECNRGKGGKTNKNTESLSSLLATKSKIIKEQSKFFAILIFIFNSQHFKHHSCCIPCSSVGKEFTSNAGDVGSIPGSGRAPGEGNGNPLQYSCLGNPMAREAWQVAAQGITKSQT